MKDIGTVQYVPFADYHSRESASLEFAHSHESIGIQITDVIAGATMRFHRSLHSDPTTIPTEISRATKTLCDSGDPRTGQGLNQAIPTRMPL